MKGFIRDTIHNLSAEELGVILALYRNGRCPTPSGRTLRRLVRKGLIKHFGELTQAGREIALALIEPASAMEPVWPPAGAPEDN